MEGDLYRQLEDKNELRKNWKKRYPKLTILRHFGNVIMTWASIPKLIPSHLS